MKSNVKKLLKIIEFQYHDYIAAVYGSSFEGDKVVNNASFRLYLKNLNNTLELIRDKKLKNFVQGGMAFKLKREYRKNIGELPKKTLIVNKNLLPDHLSISEFDAIYPYPHRVVTNEEHLELLAEENNNHVFLITRMIRNSLKYDSGGLQFSLIESGTGRCLAFSFKSISWKKKPFENFIIKEILKEVEEALEKK
jgi:hypothetical protein